MNIVISTLRAEHIKNKIYIYEICKNNFLFMNGKILFDSVTDKFKWFFANENPCVL